MFSCRYLASNDSHKELLKKILLRSQEVQPQSETDTESEIAEFLLPDSYCAIAADPSSSEAMWFVKVKASDIAVESIEDDYGNQIAPGVEYIIGQFLEKTEWGSKGSFYKLSKKKTYFYKESVVYPAVQFTGRKKGYFLSNQEYAEILNFVDQTGFTSL